MRRIELPAGAGSDTSGQFNHHHASQQQHNADPAFMIQTLPKQYPSGSQRRGDTKSPHSA